MKSLWWLYAVLGMTIGWHPLYAQFGNDGQTIVPAPVIMPAVLSPKPLHPRLPADKWFAKDKVDHAMSSVLLTASTMFVTRSELQWSESRSAVAAVSIPLVLGIGKEIYDKFHMNHVASSKDLVADIIGIGVGLLMFKD